MLLIPPPWVIVTLMVVELREVRIAVMVLVHLWERRRRLGMIDGVRLEELSKCLEV